MTEEQAVAALVNAEAFGFTPDEATALVRKNTTPEARTKMVAQFLQANSDTIRNRSIAARKMKQT
jgi:hypothetical protein